MSFISPKSEKIIFSLSSLAVHLLMLHSYLVYGSFVFASNWTKVLNPLAHSDYNRTAIGWLDV